MKKLLIILAILPFLASAQKTLDSLKGCYEGIFMYRENPDTIWTTIRPDTLIIFDTDTVHVSSQGITYYGDVVSWLLVEPNTIRPNTNYSYYTDYITFCTFNLGFDECSYSSIEEIRQHICNSTNMELVFTENDSIHYLVECFQPGQTEPMRYTWFKGKKYTSQIPDSLQNISVPEIEKNKLLVNIYPNPVKEILNIDFEKIQDVEITINDVAGKQIFKNNFDIQNIKIDFNTYEKGVYFINIRNKNGIFTEKIIYQ